MNRVEPQDLPPITAHLTPDDFRRFQAAVLGPNMIRGLYAMAGLLSVGLLFSAFVLRDLHGLTAPIVGVVVLFSVIVILRRAASTAHRELAVKQITYRFTDEHLLVEAGPSSSRLAWTHVFRTLETRDALYVFTHRAVGHVIPKRDLGSVDPAALRG